MSNRSTAALLSGMLICGVLTSCSLGPINNIDAEKGSVAVATAEVEQRTITDALALDAVAQPNAAYNITAKSDGVLTVEKDVLFFKPTEGDAVALPIPLTAVSASPMVPLGKEVRRGIPIVAVQDSDYYLNASLTLSLIHI